MRPVSRARQSGSEIGFMAQLIGLFGGTFDPVHNAHLRVALDVLETGDVDEIRLLPCRLPPHRDAPSVAAEQRLHMLRLAVSGEPRLAVDDRELGRDGPSYTVDTLASFRQQMPDTRFCLLLGMDNFRDLNRWHRWRELSHYCHFLIMDRPEQGLPLPDELERWLVGRETGQWRSLRKNSAGRVFHHPVTQLDISATDIRHRLAAGRSARYLVPDAVWDYIRDNGLYGCTIDAGG